jgi:DNA replication protein DnaD
MYILNRQIYKTKKEVLALAKQLLNSTKFNSEIPRNSDNGKFLYDLVVHHPKQCYVIQNQIVKHFSVILNDYGKREFIYVTDDNKVNRFSYLKCLKNTDSLKKSDINGAFRDAIKHQIAEFRSNNKSKIRSREPIHVDQVYPFSKLLQEFLAENNVNLESIKLTRDKQIKNKELLKKWIDYHYKKAQLQMLSAKDNLKKSDKILVI